ncbi:MAG: NUDIX domain-containing protein [Phycisphaerales bacterium]
MSEAAFLAAYDASAFDRPSVAVDIALMTVDGGSLRALLTRRAEHPARGQWSLPGGFVDPSESLDDAARRVIQAKAGLTDIFVEQLYTFGAVDRDPRTRVISVAYYALVDVARLTPAIVAGATGAADRRLAPVTVDWPGEAGGPAAVREEAGDDAGAPLPLAFDHAEMLGLVVQRLRGKLDYAPIGFEMLPDTFTLRQLQAVHETILGRSLNVDSFRRRMLASGELNATGTREADTAHRPAELYRFNPDD